MDYKRIVYQVMQNQHKEIVGFQVRPGEKHEIAE